MDGPNEDYEGIRPFNLFHPSSHFFRTTGSAISETGAVSGICFRRFGLRIARCSRNISPGGRMKNDQGRELNARSVLLNEGGRERS